MVDTEEKTWSYSHFLYKLYEPFNITLQNVTKILQMKREQTDELLHDILKHFRALQTEMIEANIKLRQNKIYIHCVDIDYKYPDNYNFFAECEKFIKSCGIIVFEHLQNFEVVKKFIEMYKHTLTTVRHPLSGDTLWHLSPFIIDLMHIYVINIYNFRGETPNERRMLAELLGFPQIEKFPHDADNNWHEDTIVFVDNECTKKVREPVALCKFLKKNGVK